MVIIRTRLAWKFSSVRFVNLKSLNFSLKAQIFHNFCIKNNRKTFNRNCLQSYKFCDWKFYCITYFCATGCQGAPERSISEHHYPFPPWCYSPSSSAWHILHFIHVTEGLTFIISAMKFFVKTNQDIQIRQVSGP